MFKVCINCKQPIIYHMNIQIEAPITMEDITTKGMIYSGNGYNEYKISKFCEVCFDETTLSQKDLTAYRKRITNS